MDDSAVDNGIIADILGSPRPRQDASSPPGWHFSREYWTKPLFVTVASWVADPDANNFHIQALWDGKPKSAGAKRNESFYNISFNIWLTYLELRLKPRTFWQWSLKKRGASFCSNQNNQNYPWFSSLTCGKAMKLPETRLFPHDKRLGAKKGPFRWYSDTGLRKIGKLDAQNLW